MGRIRASSEWEDRETAVKERLRSYRYLVKDYQQCTAFYEELFQLSASPNKEVVVKEGKCNRIEDRMLEKIDLRKQMADDLEKKKQEITEIEQWIGTLPPDERAIVRGHYVLLTKTDEFCKQNRISVSKYWRKHKKAISRLAGN